MIDLKREKGSVMVYILLAITLLAIASASTYLSVVNSVKSSETRLRALQAMYAAESGIEATIYLLNQDADLIPERVYPDQTPSLNSLADDFPLTDLIPANGMAYRTWFDGNRVVAEGISESISQRIQLQLNKDASGGNYFKHAIGARGEIVINKNDKGNIDAQIIGPIRTESTAAGSIRGLNNSNLGEGNKIIVGSGGDPSTVVSGFAEDVPRVSEPDTIDYPPMTVPEEIAQMNVQDPLNNSAVIAESGVYQSVSINRNGHKLTFNTTEKPLNVYIKGDFFAVGQSEIEITGPHPVYLYVGGNVQLAGRVTTGSGSAKDFIVVGLGEDDDNQILIAGNSGVSATVYAPEYSVTAQGAGHHKGAIIANDVQFYNRCTFEYDPQCAELELGGSYSSSEGSYSILLGSWRKL